MVRQFHPGRRDCQKLFKGIEVRMCGTLTKVVCSGKHFQTKDLASESGSARVERKASKGLPLLS